MRRDKAHSDVPRTTRPHQTGQSEKGFPANLTCSVAARNWAHNCETRLAGVLDALM